MFRRTALPSLALLLSLLPQAALAQDTGAPPAPSDEGEEVAEEGSAEPSSAQVVLELIDGRTYVGALISRTDGKVVLETKAGERVVVPESAVASLRDEATGQTPVAPGGDDSQDGWRIGMSALGAAGGMFVGVLVAGVVASSGSPEATVAGALATPALAGLGAWGAGSFYDDRATPAGAILGSTIGGFAGLGMGLGVLALQLDTSGIVASSLTITGLIGGAVMGNELELDLIELEELRLGVAPSGDGGATLMMSGRF
jgi:hypothetical protein